MRTRCRHSAPASGATRPGRPAPQPARDQLFSRSSGRFADLDGLIVVRAQPEDLGAAERSATGRLESGLLDGIEATAVTAAGPSARTRIPPRSPSSRAPRWPTVDNVDRVPGRVALVFALLGAQGSFGSKDTADQLLPDLLAPTPPGSSRPRRAGGVSCSARAAGEQALTMEWAGFPLAVAVAAFVVPAGVRGLLDAGLVRENYRGALLAFPLGAILVDCGAGRARSARLPRRPRRSRAPRSGPAALDHLRARGGASSASSTTRSAAARRRTPRGWRGHARALRGGAALDRRDQGDRGARACRLRVSGTGRDRSSYLADVALLILATNLFNLLDLRPGRAEKALAPARRGLCLGAWTAGPIELLGVFAGPVLVGALRSRCASGRCSVTPGRTWSGRSPASGC